MKHRTSVQEYGPGALASEFGLPAIVDKLQSNDQDLLLGSYHRAAPPGSAGLFQRLHRCLGNGCAGTRRSRKGKRSLRPCHRDKGQKAQFVQQDLQFVRLPSTCQVIVLRWVNDRVTKSTQLPACVSLIKGAMN